MNYWLLTTEFPPFYGGGISTYCFHTACMLSQKKHTVSVFVADVNLKTMVEEKNEALYRFIRFNPFQICSYKELGHQARINYAFALIIEEYLRKEGVPDYLEAQDYLGIAYYIQQFKFLRYPLFQELSILITLHSPAFIYLEYNKVSTYKYPDYWTCEMEKQSITAADILISPSAFMANEIKKYLTNIPPIHIVANPFTYTFQEKHVAFKKNNFVFLGKLSRQKGIFHFLQQMELVWKQKKDIQLTLIGSTDIVFHPELKTGGEIIKQKYRQYIKEGNLSIVGKAAQEQIEMLLHTAEAVIVPSIIDNLPYVVLEAMAQGKIVITTTNGGQVEIITDGINGFLFNIGEEASMQQIIHKVQNLSESDYNKICTNAITTIKKNYAYETVYPDKLKILQDFKPLERQLFPFPNQEELKPAHVPDTGNELLSIIVPFFNMGTTIEETIKSILNSSWPTIEILLVNDGSTQKESITKIEQYRNHPQIKIIDTSNHGLAAARNTGALQASGSYLTFLDADDKVDAAYYEKAIRVLKAYKNVFFAGAWTKYFENSTGMWPTLHPLPPLILYHNTINSSALVYKKEAFLASGVNDVSLIYGLEDYESIIHLLADGYTGVVLPELLFSYRVRKNSMFRKLNPTKKRIAIEYIVTKHSTFYSKFAPELVKLNIQNGPGYYFDNPCLAYKTDFSATPENRLIQIGKKIITRFPILKKTGLAIYKRLKNN